MCLLRGASQSCSSWRQARAGGWLWRGCVLTMTRIYRSADGRSPLWWDNERAIWELIIQQIYHSVKPNRTQEPDRLHRQQYFSDRARGPWGLLVDALPQGNQLNIQTEDQDWRFIKSCPGQRFATDEWTFELWFHRIWSVKYILWYLWSCGQASSLSDSNTS